MGRTTYLRQLSSESTTVEQLLIQHAPVKTVPFTAQCPVSGGGEAVQVRLAALCSMPLAGQPDSDTPVLAKHSKSFSRNDGPEPW
jgi:hypothetical protein